MPLSEPKKELPVPVVGTVDVGDGRTSLSLDGGSLRSLFQMPDPQGKAGAPGGRLIAEDVECDPQGPGLCSAEGVEGCDVVGDMEPLANDPLRGRLNVCEVSFSQEDRLTGLGGWAAVCDDSCRWSPSSSELARASESGVDVRALTLSSRWF